MAPSTIMDENLLRRRSEHNDGCLSTLTSITLHQFEIEKIEPVLHNLCRKLREVHLENNLIQKIENLHHLKELERLNLSLNIITKIENLEPLENLQYLNLLCNYITDLFSVENLKSNINLSELTLMGNPIAEIRGYRMFVIAALPSLKTLDGEKIKTNERILAEQLLASSDFKDKYAKRQRKLHKKLKKKEQEPPVKTEDGETLYGNDPASRIASSKNLNKNNNGVCVDGSKIGLLLKDEDVVAKLSLEEQVEKYGRVMQRNEGKREFEFEEHVDHYKIQVMKIKNMAVQEVDAQPTFVRIVINKKELVIRFDSNINPDLSTCKRSNITGDLLVILPKNDPEKHMHLFTK
ncbi:TilB [Acrasis kona]|uniref:TilB n=1 Tax=Acrasis kona TaxID=1008807 RepID=A0AAW2YSU4_9EUKA